MSILDDFWANVDTALERCAHADTVDEVMTILNEHFEPSSGDAFFAGSGGDRQLLDVLYWDRPSGPWRLVRYDASYYWCLADRGGAMITYIEGDVERGNTMTCSPDDH
jgi:hypothetical protein